MEQSFLPNLTPQELIPTTEEIDAKGKIKSYAKICHYNLQLHQLTLSKSTSKWMKTKVENGRRHKHSLNFDCGTGIVTVPSSSGRQMHTAVKDVRVAVCDDKFAGLFMEINDQLNSIVDDTLHHTVDDS